MFKTIGILATVAGAATYGFFAGVKASSEASGESYDELLHKVGKVMNGKKKGVEEIIIRMKNTKNDATKEVEHV